MIDRPAAPQRPPRREWFAPAVLAGSLMLHAGIVAPLLWARAEARPPVETPIEVVQLPPEPDKPQPDKLKPPTPQAKPPTPQAKPPEPPRQSQATPPAQKPPMPKPAQKPPEKERAAKPAKPQESVAQRMEQLIGPMAALAVPAAASSDNPFDDPVSYQQLILSRVAAQKREDQHDGIPTHAVISFAIGDRGEVVTCEVQEKSLDPTLDAEAVAMVHRGAPYPLPPPGAPRRFSFGLAFHTL